MLLQLSMLIGVFTTVFFLLIAMFVNYWCRKKKITGIIQYVHARAALNRSWVFSQSQKKVYWLVNMSEIWLIAVVSVFFAQLGHQLWGLVMMTVVQTVIVFYQALALNSEERGWEIFKKECWPFLKSEPLFHLIILGMVLAIDSGQNGECGYIPIILYLICQLIVLVAIWIYLDGPSHFLKKLKKKWQKRSRKLVLQN